MNKSEECLFCGNTIEITKQNEVLNIRCDCTGAVITDIVRYYQIDRDLYDDLRDDSTYRRRFNLCHISGYIHELIREGKKVHLTKSNINSISTSPLIPKSIGEKLNKLLIFIYRNTHTIGDIIRNITHQHSYNITYSPKPDEFQLLVNYLVKKNLIERYGSTNLFLTIDGIEFVQNVEQSNQTSNQCFIAMSFNPLLLEQFKNSIMPKIRDTGFEPLTVDMVHHNDDIADRIIYEIKNSHFVIADFTEQKKGVYYEAGYARGLGLEVIWTVKEDDVTNLHFDTNHLNHITWKTPEELGQKLQDRILATIPGASLRKNR